jgi:hypothetical protein
MQSFASFLIIAISFLALSFSSTAWAGSNFDGPAELPRATVASSMGDTPAPGSIISVRAGDNLQAALDRAFCGDTIELQAGAVFTGRFLVRAKSCDAGHWIVIRTSAPDSALPPQGKRITPCYAGVASLPGRPQYTCVSPHNVMAKIQDDAEADGPLVFRNGANHFRLIGLEITRVAGLRNPPVLVSVEPLGIADHIVIDRSWLHGTTHEDTQNGISLDGSNYVAMVDSYFSDFHCTQGTGACTDAHAIGGGNGTHQDGPYKISNNFLEASGEAVMFGGGPANVTPADIEILHNHFFKPWQWMPGSKNFVGGAGGHAFIVKNHLELKNASRVLIEGNLMENNWGGFSQKGYAILLSPTNQINRYGQLVCPLCQVTDVTIRYSRITHAGSGIQMVTSISGNNGNGGQALAGKRWSIHDLVIDDISKNYAGGGNLFLIANGWKANPVNTITINHVTAFPDSSAHLLMIGNEITNPSMYGFVFINNMIATGSYPVWSSRGGLTSCAAKGTPAQKINKCFTTYSFKNNALIASPDAFPPSSWPAGNFFPANPTAAAFVQYDSGNGGDYRLQPNSRYKNAGTDGRDLGADIVGLNAALAGVE